VKKRILARIAMEKRSDWAVMKEAAVLFEKHQIPFEPLWLPASATLEQLRESTLEADQSGVRVILATAGDAYLPQRLASCTAIPVIGVAIERISHAIADSFLEPIGELGGTPLCCTLLGPLDIAHAAQLAVQMLKKEATHELL
jgi:5-(carboxyamino)imidazole ribonucleotide mutase